MKQYKSLTLISIIECMIELRMTSVFPPNLRTLTHTHTKRTNDCHHTDTSMARIRFPIRVRLATVAAYTHQLIVLVLCIWTPENRNMRHRISRVCERNGAMEQWADLWGRNSYIRRNRKLFCWNKRQSNNAKCIDPRPYSWVGASPKFSFSMQNSTISFRFYDSVLVSLKTE